MKYLLCIVCLIFVVRLYSQPPTYNLCKYFGANYPQNSKQDFGYAIAKYNNNFYFLNYQPLSNLNIQSTAIFATDSIGNKLWDKHYFKKNGYLFRTKNYVIDSLMYIISYVDQGKLTTRDSVQFNIINLNTKEIKNIQNPLSNQDTFLGGIGLFKLEKDNFMIMEGMSYGEWKFELSSDFRIGFILTKLDKEGKRIWTQNFVDWNSYYFTTIGACSDEEGNIYIVSQIQDRVWYMGPQNLHQYYPRIELFKIDKNGNAVFNKTIKKGNFDNFDLFIAENSDVAYHNGQILISHYGSMSDEGSLVYAYSKEGEAIWRYSGKQYEFLQSNVVPIKEGFLVVAVTVGNGAGNWSKARITKFDFKGNKVWDRTYMDSTRFVWLNIEDAIELEDGRIAVSGTVSTNTGIGTSILLMTLNSDGCYESNCQDTAIWHLPETTPVSIQEIERKQNDYHIKISPNPATELLNIEVTLPHYDEKAELVLCDLTGKELIKTRLPDYAYIGYMDVGQLSAGMYILQLRQRSRILKSEKVVVER